MQLGKIGLNFLNIIPKLGKVIYEFFADLFTDLFHGIYNQQIEPQKAKKVIIVITFVAAVTTITFSSINYFYDGDVTKQTVTKKEQKKSVVKEEVKKPEIKKETKKLETKKIEKKKEVKKSEKKPKLEVKRKNVDEVILPNLF